MCGAIACSASLKGRSHLYHLGRMISYVTLGGLAGLLGEHILNSELLFMQKISAFLMGAVLIMIGMSFIANWKMQSQQGFNFFLPLLKKNKDQQLFLGLLTGLLPCGWLYTFVTAAIATKSAVAGMICLFLFWLGSVPALTFMSSGLGNLMKAQSQKSQKIVGGLLVGAGIYSVVAHLLAH